MNKPVWVSSSLFALSLPSFSAHIPPLRLALFSEFPGSTPRGVQGAQAAAPLLLADYSDSKTNKNGVERLLIDDKSVGSSSKATQKCENGALSVKGDLVPGRGVPAFISQVSLLSADGQPKDMSGYVGVRLRVKVIKGILCVQVASSEIKIMIITRARRSQANAVSFRKCAFLSKT